ncbi:transcription factor zip1 [Coccidioides immitis H538.4]|uniref:Transcription factor zip1 n=1 Tax=Coccidioides immitis H538.4 TaxID=396776 RepID=A0A0J8RR38_COCIT|nr:transcription factor zip1 [Coccidioides immitis H538.4]
MSGYNGRRAPNFSQYLNDLNTVPSPYDQTLQQDQGLFDVDAELALFTNAQFFDFDSRGDMSSHVPVSLGEDLAQSEPTSSQDAKYLDMLNVAWPYYLIRQWPPLQAPRLFCPLHSKQPSHPDFRFIARLISPFASQPTPQETQPRPQHTTTTPTTVGTKRKQDASTLDEAARLAQEEDKRRRNTAASARFRIKKKEREKNLERTVKDVTAKNAALEARVSQLELENRWLKNLITEKNGSMLSDGDISGMFTKFRDSKEGQAATQQQQVKTETDETESRAS